MAKKKPNKKKRRANYQAPTKNAPKQKAAPPVDEGESKAGKQAAAAPEPAPKKKAKVPARPAASQRRNVPARPSRNTHARGTLSWWLLGIGIVGAVVGVIVLTSVLGEDQVGETSAVGWDLPALDEANDPDGDGRITLAEFQGKPVVLNFFASWCVNCERELPRFRQASIDYEGEVEVLFINSNETGNWRPMAERTGIDDQILIDDIGGSRNNGLYRSLGGPGGMPLTAFYDADGQVVEVFPGELSVDQLYSRIDAILEAA